MKKIILVLAVSLFSFAACDIDVSSGSTATDSTITKNAVTKNTDPNVVYQGCYEDGVKRYCSMLIKSIDMEDGDVNSLLVPNVIADGHNTPMKLGRQYIETVPVDYRTVLSFNTCHMPKNVQIEGVYLQTALFLQSYDESVTYETLYQSVLNNLVLDFNTLTGFGGSPVFTGLDMYGYQTNRIPIGSLDYPEIPAAFLNAYGKTQIRFGFISNPYDAFYLLTGHIILIGNDRPRLEIVWSEDL